MIKKHWGFTLIELLLYVSLAAIFLIGLSVFLHASFQTRNKNQVMAEVDQQGIQVAQLITLALRNATEINSPTAGTSAAVLSITTPMSANNPTVFDLSSGVIRITEGSSPAEELTNSQVTSSSLNFQNLSRPGTPGNIKISFTLTFTSPSTRNEYSYSKTFYGSASLR